VHQATVFAMRNLPIAGRPLDFLHAHSATEARRILAAHTDIAVILLDVVMEEVNAGLELVRHIRDELGQQEIRIILRTGQPGYAPEMEVVRDYDINDYKTKSELTRIKLYTTLTAAIRSYRQLHIISASRRGLDLIVQGSARLMAERGISDFAAGVITQITGLLGLPPEGLIITRRQNSGPIDPVSLRVVAAAGRYVGLLNQPLDQLSDGEVRSMLIKSLADETSLFNGTRTVLLMGGRSGMMMAAYIDTLAPLADTDQQLIDVFCTNMAVCLDNLDLLAQLNASAFVDPQLRMPNRTRLVQEIDHRRRQPGGDELLILLNLDHFSEANEALGHPYGDRILRAVADRLLEHCARQTMVARVHGDTFGLLGPRAQLDPEAIAALFREPFEIDLTEQMISASQGCVMLTEVPGDGADTVKNASIALKRAKASGLGSYCFYDREMGIEVQERVRLLRNLRSAFQHDRLFLCFQPQVSLADGRIVGAEALLRWKTENGELIPPERFIAIAEYSGLIVDIGQWVLRNACHRQVVLTEAGFAGFRMAVNVSLAQFRHPQFIQTLQAAIADTGINPALLELEITESMAMLEPDYITSVIREVKALGISVAVDDFGTGFSSLSYLQQLDVDRLKIDRGFIRAMQTADSTGGSIAQTVIQLGHNLGLSVIAEGVETEAQAIALHRLGCHEAQGFLFARPMDSTELATWLAPLQDGHPLPY
jgi:diguanylate cyclase (GGDEF)-like protein